MAGDKCGASRSVPGAAGLVCDKAPGHDGDHRGYLEQQDEVLFWPSSTSPAAPPVEFLADVLGLDQPWAIPDVLERLAAAADHLLLNHSCDHLGYEGINAARDAARAHVERLAALRSRSSARA